AAGCAPKPPRWQVPAALSVLVVAIAAGIAFAPRDPRVSTAPPLMRSTKTTVGTDVSAARTAEVDAGAGALHTSFPPSGSTTPNATAVPAATSSRAAGFNLRTRL